MKQMIYQKDRITPGEILFEDTYKNIDFVIVSYGTHPCAYIKIPESNKYYNIDYLKADELLNFPVNGGLTFYGGLSKLNKDGRWYGWDYAHCGDYCGYEEAFLEDLRTGGKKWTTEEIYEEVKAAIDILVREL